jgi:hypothetical protein
MWNASVRSARSFGLRSVVPLACAVGLFLLTVGALAQDPVSVMKVEEDWELVLNDPSTDNTSPQVTCLISPVNHADGVYASLELNHGSLPDFSSGGVQLQAWSGEDWLSVRDYANTTLANTGEVVTWTHRLRISDGQLIFKVVNGSSTSWGAFGSSGNLRLALTSGLSNLNLYSPDVSKAQSGIGFGSQRVQKLVLKAVRYYDGSGNLLLEDTTPRVVHQQ